MEKPSCNFTTWFFHAFFGNFVDYNLGFLIFFGCFEKITTWVFSFSLDCFEKITTWFFHACFEILVDYNLVFLIFFACFEKITTWFFSFFFENSKSLKIPENKNIFLYFWKNSFRFFIFWKNTKLFLFSENFQAEQKFFRKITTWFFPFCFEFFS